MVGLIALGVSTLLDRRNERRIGVVLLLLGVAFTLPPLGRVAGVGVLCLVMAYLVADGLIDPTEAPRTRLRSSR